MLRKGLVVLEILGAERAAQKLVSSNDNQQRHLPQLEALEWGR